ncbi:unnamed protein product [Clonostachys solani]|uniref:Carboxypeptidase n=1 Tax=Clonostachys solani TaxID=160281 RepID=A0A9N9Z8M2_9HYPO|nr:unnamed protein product [Clonostachys solani]
MHALTILVLAGLAAAQFPPRPEGRKILRSKFHENVTISYKEPNICELEDAAKSYAGHVHLPPDLLNDINGEKQDYPINTFFWFFESRSAPQDAPLAIWLNGGPGGSSLLGLFAENGPCIVKNDSTTTEYNPWSWNNFVNILYIDQPNQVGFSYDVPTNGTMNPADDTITVADFSETIPESNFTSRVGTFSSQKASNTANTTDQAAHALWHFAQIWFSEFPHYKPNDDKISLWTESYGGHYGPGFMRFFQEQNEKIANGTIEEEDAHYLHLGTLGIVNGLVDIVLQGEAWIEFPYNNTYGIQVFNESLHEELMTNWTAPGGCKEQLLACQNSLGMFDVNTINHGSVNVKEICAIEPWCNLQSVSLYNDLGHGFYDIAHPRADPFPPYHILGYLSQEHVLAAIGSPVNFTAISMTTNSIFMGTNDFIHGGFLDSMAYLLDSGVSIHMIYGDRDYACNWIGGEAASLAVPYSRQADFSKSSYGKFQVSDGDDGFAGLTRQLGNFSFTRLFQAGHMAPSYQPAAAYEHFMRATFHKDIFTGTNPVNENLQNDGEVFDRWLKNPAPEWAAPQCYVLEPGTCTEEVWAKVKEGKAKIENYYVVEILDQPEEVQKERLDYDEL